MQSYYRASSNQKLSQAKLLGEASTDVCIIGGGYTGLSSALYLAKKNTKVVLIEAHKIASGASGANGGQVSGGMRKDQLYLEKTFGKELAFLLWSIGEKAKLNVKALIDEHQIKCDYKKGIAYPNHKQKYCAKSEFYANYLHKHYNYSAIEYLDKDKMLGLCGSDAYYGGCFDKQAAHCHPLNYALGIAKAALDAGAIIYENSKASHYKIVGNKVKVVTKDGVVIADRLVIACNGYLGNIETRLNNKILPMNNYIVATKPLDADTVTRINPNDIAFADSRFIINYFCLSADKRLLFGGGENYSQHLVSNIAAIVTKPLERVYPFLKGVAIDYAWGGKLAITMNRMPVFATFNQEKVLTMQGYSGHGVALASYAGNIIAEKITGNGKMFDTIANIFVPNFPGGTFLRGINMKVGMLYYSLLDNL